MRPPNNATMSRSEELDIWLMAEVALHIMRTERTCMIPYPPTAYYREQGKSFPIKLFVGQLISRVMSDYMGGDESARQRLLNAFLAGEDIGLFAAKRDLGRPRLRTHLWQMAVDGSSSCQQPSLVRFQDLQPQTLTGSQSRGKSPLTGKLRRLIVNDRKTMRTRTGRKV